VKARWTSIAVGLALLCAPSFGATQSLSSPPGDPEAGARLFRTRGCIECHAADLARLRQEPRTLYALAAGMWNHFPKMADRIRASNVKTPYFTSGEMTDLVAFLSGDVPRASDDLRLLGGAGDPQRGRQLVTDKGCLVCHSLSLPRGRRAGSLDDLKGLETPWSVVAQMWNHAFLMRLEAQGQGGSWAPLSAAEMADLVAFLQSLMQAR
jgi:mono/diheme cytochrome c family protein